MADNCLKSDVNPFRKRRTLVECASCMGYGHLDDDTGQPTIDRRNRKCGDCGGSGSVPVARESPPAKPP